MAFFFFSSQEARWRTSLVLMPELMLRLSVRQWKDWVRIMYMTAQRELFPSAREALHCPFLTQCYGCIWSFTLTKANKEKIFLFFTCDGIITLWAQKSRFVPVLVLPLKRIHPWPGPGRYGRCKPFPLFKAAALVCIPYSLGLCEASSGRESGGVGSALVILLPL